MLFNTKDIKLHDDRVDQSHQTDAIAGLRMFNERGWQYLREHVGTLAPNRYHHFATNGYWSAIHLLEYLVEQCGECDIWFTSWSISEDSIRRMVKLKEDGLAKSYISLLDRRVKLYTTSAYYFAREHMDITLMPIHAKVTVIKGSKMSAVVNQSANYNENKRVETGIISTVPDDIEYYIE